MQFFILGRDKPGAGEIRRSLLHPHWAFMAGYTDAMIARGPTTSADGKTVTGSMHIVELQDARAAHVFAHDDPLAKGGVFEHIEVRRFQNLLGRTMWQFAADAANRRFLFVGEARNGASMTSKLLDAQLSHLRHSQNVNRVIVSGSLYGIDGVTWEGTVMLLEVADIEAAKALIGNDPAAGQYGCVELRPWRFGGQENLKDLVMAPNKAAI